MNASNGLRPTIPATMFAMAFALARRSTCRKLSVGAVLVDARSRVLSVGYNGVPAGWTHCRNGAMPCEAHCHATHAESNALLSSYAPPQFIHACYVTHSPCVACLKQLVQTGCREIHYVEPTEELEHARNFWTRDPRKLVWTRHDPLTYDEK